MKEMIKKILFIILLSGVAALLFRLYFEKEKFYYAGTLETTKVDISVQVASAVAKVHVQEGDSFKSGDLLVELSCEDYKNAAHFAHGNYTRYAKLLKSGSATPETVDLMENRKNDADIRLSWCLLKAPLNGSVLTRYHEPGEWVTPGSKILTIANPKDVWAYFYVPQEMLSKLSLGMKIKTYLPETNMKLFEGTIIKINEEAEFTPKNVQTREERTRLVYGIKISFRDANQDGVLKSGMTLEAEFPE